MTFKKASVSLIDRPIDTEARDNLLAAGHHPVLADCLARRGIRSPEDLDPALHRLLPARGLRNIEIAAQNIGQAIISREHILVVGDYDADGATATAVLMRGLKRLGADISFVVPDRFRFGYGLTPGLVDEVISAADTKRPDWIVTVDNGISCSAGVSAAQSYGIQVMITDHHLPGPTLPDALIINPQLPDCGFPSKNLAGVGVAFYLLVAVRAWLAQNQSHRADHHMPRIDDLLSLVALGTVADLVRLDENNRRLVSQGLQRIQRGLAPPGLTALFDTCGRAPQEATTQDLGLLIGPRLNAAGRLSDMAIGIRCLLADSLEEAHALAAQLHDLNQSRRALQKSQTESAIQKTEILLSRWPAELESRPRALVLYDPDWHQGVVGLIAGNIKDRIHRPTLAFAPSNPGSELLKGSGRSVTGVHLRDILARVDSLSPGLMEAFGGHAMAAGVTLKQSHLREFEEKLQQAAEELIDPTLLAPTLSTDGPLQSEYFSLETAKRISNQVWGQGFPVPVFRNRFMVRQQHRLKDRHLRLELVLAEDPRRRVSGIWFDGPISVPLEVTLAFCLQVNVYMGLETVQLLIQAAEGCDRLH